MIGPLFRLSGETGMAMITCEKCGNNVGESTSECPFCGTPKRPNLAPYFVVIGFVTALLVMAIIEASSGSKPEQDRKFAPQQTHTQLAGNESSNDCRVNGTAGLPPGVEPYSLDQAFEKRQACEYGNFSACYELCRRHLNGDRPGYSCPPVQCSGDSDVSTIPSKIIKGAIACDHLKDEAFTETASDDAVRNWISNKHKACVILNNASDVKLITRTGDGYYQVAIKNEHWHQRWVTDLDVAKLAIVISDAQEQADARRAAQMTTDVQQTESAFWGAVADDNSKLVILLISKGADPNAERADGETPLQDALLDNSPHMMQTLLSHGANPNMPLKNGRTVLFYAVTLGNVDNIRLLLSYGADPEQRRNGDLSPIELSRMSSDNPETKIVLPLLERAAARLRSKKGQRL